MQVPREVGGHEVHTVRGMAIEAAVADTE